MAVVAKVEPEEIHEVMEKLTPVGEEAIRTRYGPLVQRVFAEAQSRILLELCTLEFGEVPESLSARLEAGTDADFERWMERVLFADTLEQVFADAPGA